MKRITQKILEYQVGRINELTNSRKTYSTAGKINVGHYHLDYGYRCVSLVRTTNTGGGVTVTSNINGHGTKRELYNWMDGFVAGLSK